MKKHLPVSVVFNMESDRTMFFSLVEGTINTDVIGVLKKLNTLHKFVEPNEIDDLEKAFQTLLEGIDNLSAQDVFKHALEQLKNNNKM